LLPLELFSGGLTHFLNNFHSGDAHRILEYVTKCNNKKLQKRFTNCKFSHLVGIAAAFGGEGARRFHYNYKYDYETNYEQIRRGLDSAGREC